MELKPWVFGKSGSHGCHGSYWGEWLPGLGEKQNPGSPRENQTAASPLVVSGESDIFVSSYIKANHFVWSTGLPGNDYNPLIFKGVY